MNAKWRNHLQIADNPWIAGHKVNGIDVCPAAGMLIMAMEAVFQVSDKTELISGYKFREVSFSKALGAPSDSQKSDIETEFYLRKNEENTGKSYMWHEFCLYICETDEWMECCRGSISIQHASDMADGAIPNLDEIVDETFPSEREIGDCDDCTESLDKGVMYNYLDSMGLSYGPAFQGLYDIQGNGSGRITATADLLNWKTTYPDTSLASHVIHPSGLDLVFQLLIPAISQGCKNIIPTTVPARLDSLWISDSLRFGQCQLVKIRTRATMKGLRHTKASVAARYADSGEPCITGTWTSTSIASLDDVTAQVTQDHRLCYKILTKPDIELLENAEMKDWCSTDENIDFPDHGMIEKMDSLCYWAMSGILADLTDEESKPEKLELRRYIEWTKCQMTKVKSEAPAAWTYTKNHQTYFTTLLDTVSSFGVEGRLLARVAKELPRIFSGKLSALEVLFQDDLLESTYSEGFGIEHVFEQTASYVDLLAHKNPRMHILELGAGAGTGTSRILEALANHPGQRSRISRFAEYSYTDISPGFLKRGMEKFADHDGNITYSILDIEKDPLQQGFTTTYDLVVALNVVHATSSPKDSLRNARKLLRPGGKLLLIEVTGSNQMQIEFIFGLLPGWWLSTEQSRETSPLMSEQKWHSQLLSSGFSGIDLTLRNHDDPRYHTYSAMISTALAHQDKETLPLCIDLVLDRRSSFQVALASQLEVIYHGQNISCKLNSLEDIASQNHTNMNLLFLLEMDGPFLYSISEVDFSLLQKILLSVQSMLWVTDGADASPLTSLVRGLQRTYRAENEALRFNLFMLSERCIKPSTAPNIAKISRSMREESPELAETEYTERKGNIYIDRVVESNHVNNHVPLGKDPRKKQFRAFGQLPLRSLALGLGAPGLLNTLHFEDDKEVLEQLNENEIEVSIRCVGVNFRDILTSLGQVNDDVLGLEGAGLVARAGDSSGFKVGDRVCGLFLGSYKTFARCNAKLACHIPKGMDFQTAAAIPLVSSTAYQAVVNVAQLQSSESILVHSGAGGLGQATIQMAKLKGAEIFVTVGTREKREFMMTQYNIAEDHIFSSRATSFAQSIKRLTNERGVDVVVNSLAGEGLRASWECIAPFGRFIETGRKDIDSFGYLPMSSFANDTTFASVSLTNIMRQKPDLAGQLLKTVMELLAVNKISPPKPLRIYGVAQIEDAFRQMQSGKTIGKLVVEFRPEEDVAVSQGFQNHSCC